VTPDLPSHPVASSSPRASGASPRPPSTINPFSFARSSVLSKSGAERRELFRVALAALGEQRGQRFGFAVEAAFLGQVLQLLTLVPSSVCNAKCRRRIVAGSHQRGKTNGPPRSSQSFFFAPAPSTFPFVTSAVSLSAPPRLAIVSFIGATPPKPGIRVAELRGTRGATAERDAKLTQFRRRNGLEDLGGRGAGTPSPFFQLGISGRSHAGCLTQFRDPVGAAEA